MSLRISQNLSNFPKYGRDKSFLDFCLVYMHLVLKSLKLIRDKFVNNTFSIEILGKSVAEFKLGAGAGQFLLFNIVQGAHHSLENFQYHRVYMLKEYDKSISLKSIPNLNTCTGINSVEIIDFLWTCNKSLECIGKLNLLKAQFCAFNTSDSTTIPLTVQIGK